MDMEAGRTEEAMQKLTASPVRVRMPKPAPIPSSTPA